MLQTSFLQSEMKRGGDCLQIEIGDHVRVPNMAGQSGIVVAKNTIKDIEILHCYNLGECIDIVFDEGLVVIKNAFVYIEDLTGDHIDIDKMKQELIDKGKL